MSVVLATGVSERSRSRIRTPRARTTPRASADKPGSGKPEQAGARGSDQPPARRPHGRQGADTTASPSQAAAGKPRHGCATGGRGEKQEERSLRHRDANRIWKQHGNIHASTWVSPARDKRNSNGEAAACPAKGTTPYSLYSYRLKSYRKKTGRKGSFLPTLRQLFNIASSSSAPRTRQLQPSLDFCQPPKGKK